MKKLFAAIALAGLISGTASAQLKPTQETGSRIFTQPKAAPDPAIVASFSKTVARCAMSRLSTKDVDEFLAATDQKSTVFNMDGQDWHQIEQTVENCMEAYIADYNADVRLAQLQMDYSAMRLRALFVEEIYLSANDHAITIGENDAELTNRTFVSTGDDLGAAQGLANFSDCIVYRNTQGADQLLRTEPGSSDEIAAAQALASTLGNCLIDGQTIKFTPCSIRALVADGLWSRAVNGSKSEAAE